jgi:putative hemolysin
MTMTTLKEEAVDAVSRMEQYRHFASIRIDSGKYTVKTVSTPQELRGALALRSEVFREEFGVDGSSQAIWDIDELDFVADHLILMEKASQKVVGTYRLICSERSDRFYSQSEFDMDRLVATPGVKLELSRACTHPDFRGGMAMVLLWKGIGAYMAAVNASVLFGCSSFRTEDPKHAAELQRYFIRKGQASLELGVTPLPSYKMEGIEDGADLPFSDELSIPIPPLVQLYLKAGAKLAPEPAHDRAFHCLDFLTVLPVDAIDERFARKYTAVATEAV